MQSHGPHTTTILDSGLTARAARGHLLHLLIATPSLPLYDIHIINLAVQAFLFQDLVGTEQLALKADSP
jgi:hypothetical protein